MARAISGYSPAPRQPRPRQPALKSKCQQDPNSIACLEEQISGIRSQTAVWDLSSQTATGRKLDELIAALQKKKVFL